MYYVWIFFKDDYLWTHVDLLFFPTLFQPIPLPPLHSWASSRGQAGGDRIRGSQLDWKPGTLYWKPENLQWKGLERIYTWMMVCLKKNGAVFYRLPGWRPASILPRSRGHQRGQDFLEDDVRCCWVGSSRWWTWRVWRVIFDRLFHHNLDKRKKTLGTFVRRIWRFPKMNFHFHFHRHCWENIPRKWRVWVRESHVFAWNGGGFFWEGITWYH